MVPQLGSLVEHFGAQRTCIAFGRLPLKFEDLADKRVGFVVGNHCFRINMRKA